jgi:hypothetical protein
VFGLRNCSGFTSRVRTAPFSAHPVKDTSSPYTRQLTKVTEWILQLSRKNKSSGIGLSWSLIIIKNHWLGQKRKFLTQLQLAGKTNPWWFNFYG